MRAQLLICPMAHNTPFERLQRPSAKYDLSGFTLRRQSPTSKEEKSFGFCVFVYILCVFVYILCVFVYVFLGSQSQGSYISRDCVVDL